MPEALIQIVEATAFTEKAARFLSPTELRGLRFVLADEPNSGEPVADMEDFKALVFAGCRVLYLVRDDGDKVYLVDVESLAPAPALSTAEKSAVRKTFESVAPQIGIALAKQGLKWLWEILTTHHPF